MDELKNILLIDIETVAATRGYDELGERMKSQWARKASYLRKRDEDQTDDEFYRERAGIYAEFGKIIVIAIGKYTLQEGVRGIKTKVFSGHDEKLLLEDFCNALLKMDPQLRMCAHNGKEFDFPYLCRRLLVHGLSLPPQLNIAGKKSWDVPHLDTMDLWKFADYKHYTSLDLLTALFDIPTSKGDMDGSRVNFTYYEEDGLTRIAEYCVADVVAVGQLYLRLRGLPIVADNQIERT